MRDRFRKQDGYFTVEATFVFTISFMALLVFIFLGITLYQKVHAQSIADQTSSRGAIMYATRTTNMNTGFKDINDFRNIDPYRYFFDSSYRATARNTIHSHFESSLGSANVRAADRQSLSTEIKFGLTRSVTVSAERRYDLPIISTFGYTDSPFNIKADSTSFVTDMPELIRNVDYGTDILNRFEVVSGAISSISGLKGKLETFIAKIK